jgi:hypothetical protein
MKRGSQEDELVFLNRKRQERSSFLAREDEN